MSGVRKITDKTKKSKNLFSVISDEFDTEAQAIFFNLSFMLVVGSSLEKLIAIAIGNRVLSSHYPEKRQRYVHHQMDTKHIEIVRCCSKERDDSGVVLTFSWKRKIANVIFKQRIYNDMILNFYQTLLRFTDRTKQSLLIKSSSLYPL